VIYSSLLQLLISEGIFAGLCLLLDFAAALIPGLDAKEIDLLFTAVKPIIQVYNISCGTTLVSSFSLGQLYNLLLI
jgi:hypothetical protein